MYSFDFSKDKPNISEPIPAGTKVLVRMNFTAGGADFPNTPVAERRGQLTAAKEGDALYLKAEFTVLRGPYKGRKFWENMTFAGGKLDEKGNSIAAGITRGNVRSILDASSGTSSKDETPTACAKRVLPNGFADLQGRVFATKIGIEPAKGNYAAKNKLGTILTIDHKDYPKSEDEFDNPVVAGSQPAKLPAIAAPAWGAHVVMGKPAETSTALRDATSSAMLAAAAGVVAAETVGAFAHHNAQQPIAAADPAIPAWMRS